jgi:hypothetical protein
MASQGRRAIEHLRVVGSVRCVLVGRQDERLQGRDDAGAAQAACTALNTLPLSDAAEMLVTRGGADQPPLPRSGVAGTTQKLNAPRIQILLVTPSEQRASRRFHVSNVVDDLAANACL